MITINSQLNILRQERLEYFTAYHDKWHLFYAKGILKRGKRLMNEYAEYYHNTFLHKRILNCWEKQRELVKGNQIQRPRCHWENPFPSALAHLTPQPFSSAQYLNLLHTSPRTVTRNARYKGPRIKTTRKQKHKPHSSIVVTPQVDNNMTTVYKHRYVTHPAHNPEWKGWCLHFGGNPGCSRERS